MIITNYRNSLETIITRYLNEVEYMLSSYIRKRNPCNCKLSLCHYTKILGQKLLVYLLFYVDHFDKIKDQFDFKCEVNKFLKSLETSISISLVIFNLYKEIVKFIYFFLTDGINSKLDAFLRSGDVRDFEKISNDIVDWIDNLFVLISGININCEKCNRDYCVHKSNCQIHDLVRNCNNFIQFYIFPEYVKNKELFENIISAIIKTVDCSLDDMPVIVDGRYLPTQYNNGELIKQYEQILSVIERNFRKVYYYRIPKVFNKTLIDIHTLPYCIYP